MIYSDENKRIDITSSGTHRICECSFVGLHNENGLGGAISVTNENCQFYCYDSFFLSCSAKSSGGIHITNSDNTVCSHICAINCSNEENYAYFSYFKQSTNLICDLFSTHFCKGKSSTSRFASKQVTVSNINSTNNEGDQEPGFLLSNFDYASLKYADCVSNNAERMGLNLYTGERARADHIHYDNCTITYSSDEYINCHIKFHLTQDTQLLNSYVSVDINSNAYAIYSCDSLVTLNNIYFIGSSDIKGSFGSTNDIKIISNRIKTLHYSFLNTRLCQANVFICNSLKQYNIFTQLTSLSLLYIFILIKI